MKKRVAGAELIDQQAIGKLGSYGAWQKPYREGEIQALDCLYFEEIQDQCVADFISA